MLAYALRRSLGALPTLFVIVTLTFFLMRVVPGGPFDQDRQVTPEVAANLNAKYHLDEPLWLQYGRYLGQLAQGDLGPSFQYRDYTVNELIATGFPVSLALGSMALILALLVGGALGMVAALRRNGAVDHAVMATAMVGISVPTFVVAPLCILVFAVYLDWLPAGGWHGPFSSHAILPVVTLALPLVAYIARLTRTSLIEVLGQSFIRTARAKGLPTRLVLFRHALRPTLLPLASFLGPAAAGVLTGSVVIEQIYGIPGLGRYFVQGALNRDYTLVMGVVVFYGVLIVLFNLLVDLAYALLDPRIRY